MPISNFKFLDDLIHSGSKEIKLDCDVSIDDSEQDYYLDGIKIDIDNLVIDGNNHSIDANELSRIFLISSTDVIIKNLHFKNGNYLKDKSGIESIGGGAIYAMPDSSSELKNCVFLNNKSDEGAGAILNKSKSLKISNSRFLKNSSKKYGGAILNIRKSILELNNCDFEYNVSGEDGGAIYNWLSFVKVDSSNFKNNNAGNIGGAIDNYLGALYFKDSIFRDNKAKKDGGAIFNGEMLKSMDGCTLKNNNAFLKGGALYMSKSSGGNIENSCFESNRVLGPDGQGGAIYSNSAYDEDEKFTFDLMNCNFLSNGSYKDGRAILNRGYLNLTNVNFKYNQSLNNDQVLTNYGKNAEIGKYDEIHFVESAFHKLQNSINDGICKLKIVFGSKFNHQ